jgi:hypothetical protein
VCVCPCARLCVQSLGVLADKVRIAARSRLLVPPHGVELTMILCNARDVANFSRCDGDVVVCLTPTPSSPLCLVSRCIHRVIVSSCHRVIVSPSHCVIVSPLLLSAGGRGSHATFASRPRT